VYLGQLRLSKRCSLIFIHKKLLLSLLLLSLLLGGPCSLVGIATDYGLDGLGSNPSGDEIFRPSIPVLRPTQPSVKWVPGLSRG